MMYAIMDFIFAHAFGQRYELPISLSLFVIGGAVVVLISFLFVIRSKVDGGRTEQVESVHLAKFNWFWAAVSFIVLLLSILTGITGSQEVAENILPTLFWLVLWIAVPLSCGLIGNWTEWINPFANVSKLIDRSGLRQSILAKREALEWPKQLGWWPAAVLFFALACGELIFNQTATLPAVIGWGLLLYFVFSGFMGLLYGAGWLERGEVFTVLFNTWGKLGYFRFGSAGRNGFAGGLTRRFENSPSRIAFVLLLLISVSFDGLISTTQWGKFRQHLPSYAQGDSWQYQLIAVAIFILLGFVIWGLFSFFANWTTKLARVKQSSQAALTGLLPSLLPISFGYLFAHNLEYLITNGQLLFPLIGNPTGKDSWPIHLPLPFNDDFEPNIHVLPSSYYWYIAVAVIIAVHVVAIILAHRHLATQTKDARRATLSEYPWICVMILYTMFSLWLLAQPLTKEKPKETSSLNPTQVVVRADSAP